MIKTITLYCLWILSYVGATEITPHKIVGQFVRDALPQYPIPQKARLTIERKNGVMDTSDIVYYYSPPRRATFPIVILCTGSTEPDNIYSVIHVHRMFLEEFQELGLGLITIEQQGVDGAHVDTRTFMRFYTRSHRLHDHQRVIDHLKYNPPQGWNKKFIFVGISEGGVLVTTLTANNFEHTLATINWCGAGDDPWDDELWDYTQYGVGMPWYHKLRAALPNWIPLSINIDTISREQLDQNLAEAIRNPTHEEYFFGMTYQYHADALKHYPAIRYGQMKTPYLVVTGTKDPILGSCDRFVAKAKQAGVPMTYMRIKDMDHFIRKRPDIIQQSLDWLKGCMHNA